MGNNKEQDDKEFDDEYMEAQSIFYESILNSTEALVIIPTLYEYIIENDLYRMKIENKLRYVIKIIYKNFYYIELLRTEGFVNFTLNNGSFKISNYKIKCKFDDSSNIIGSYTTMDIELMDNDGNIVVNGISRIYYNRFERGSDINVILLDQFRELFINPLDIHDKDGRLDIDIDEADDLVTNQYNIKNVKLFKLMNKVKDIIGDISDYFELNHKRCAFIMDKNDKE